MLEFLSDVLVIVAFISWLTLMIALIIALIFIVTELIIDLDINCKNRSTRIAKAINRFMFFYIPKISIAVYLEFKYRYYVINQGPNARYKCMYCFIYGKHQRFNKYDYIAHGRDVHGF